MKLRTPKYKNSSVLAVILFLLILLFEIIPGYFSLAETLYSVAIQKFSDDNREELDTQLNQLKTNQIKLKKLVYGEFNSSSENYNFSNTLEKFSVVGDEFNLSVDSIKPLKKIKKGRLDFQRISIGFNGDYENAYNYCRWLELKSSAMGFEELVISKQKDSGVLQTSVVIDVLFAGAD